LADNPAFYRQRALDERNAAAAATLDNVRERCERAAAAWETMAVRYDRIDKQRAEREAQVVHREVAEAAPVIEPAAS
jgi:hypothetical protein